MGNRFASRYKAATRKIVTAAKTVERETLTPDFTHMDQCDNAADIYYSNSMAFLKLRQNKRLPKVRQDVLRHILEYLFPKVLCWTYSEPYHHPIQTNQDRHFPVVTKLDYNN